MHNEELHSLYFSSDIIGVIKSRKIEMIGACSAHGGDEKCAHSFGWKG
jgi:hypothetical protein